MRAIGDARYYSLDCYLKQVFGRRLYKLALDGGMSCPNRDGTLDTRGCIFCSAGSGSFAAPVLPSVTEQIETAKALISHKVTPSPLPSYIAYFQSYTNTYPPRGVSPVTYLERLFREAIDHPEVAVLSIATRPDCLSEEICGLLAELNEKKPVWVELGLQTATERGARWTRRGYTNEVFAAAADRLAALSLPVIAHLILGIPGETTADMRSSVRYLNRLPIWGVKFHLLHVLRDTDLADCLSSLHLLSEEEYCDALLACLAELSPDTVVHRITGDGSRSQLLAPLWSLDKKNVLNRIRHEMKVRGFRQGMNYR